MCSTTSQVERLQARRSFIFVPGLRPELYPKALASGADMVCVELEDGIAEADKDKARSLALALFDTPPAEDGIERTVRINGLQEPMGQADVAAVLATDTPPPALMLPKVCTVEEIERLDEALTKRGHSTRLHVIIETTLGLEAAFDIANASERIDALFFGGVDMAADLRCVNAWEPLLYARSRVVHAAASAGVDVIDVPYLDLDDTDGMIEEAQRAKALGFSGKGAVHPKQISALNRVFTPSAQDIARARDIVDCFEASDAALLVVDGKLIEKPVLREMYRVLAAAEAGER